MGSRYGVDDQPDQVPTHFRVKPTKKSALHWQCCCVIVRQQVWHMACVLLPFSILHIMNGYAHTSKGQKCKIQEVHAKKYIRLKRGRGGQTQKCTWHFLCQTEFHSVLTPSFFFSWPPPLLLHIFSLLLHVQLL
jgi:hypothetical protein